MWINYGSIHLGRYKMIEFWCGHGFCGLLGHTFDFEITNFCIDKLSIFSPFNWPLFSGILKHSFTSTDSFISNQNSRNGVSKVVL